VIGAAGEPSLTVDLLNLEAWQAVIGVLVALGLSPAPWILGLALGRIQFTGPAERGYTARTEELKQAHAREVESMKAAAKEALAGAVEHHTHLIAEKDARYAELKESRDYYRKARLEERDRADAATVQLLDSVEVAKASMQALTALDEAAKDAIQ
jgi:hypothetical protein